MSGAILARPLAASRWDVASAALLVTLLGLALATFGDYGVSWDEPVHVANGEHLLRYYASGFADRSYRDFENLHLYGGFYDLLHTLLSRPLEPLLGLYESRHLVNALFALGGLAAAWLLARRLGGARAAFFAALILALLPTWYGHAFSNPKDMPFAVLYALSLYALSRLAAAAERVGLRHALAAGLTIGLSIATRIGGFLLLGYLAPIVLATALAAARAGGRRAVLRVAAMGLLVVATSCATALTFWPWLLEAPLQNALAAAKVAGQFPRAQPVLYMGQHLYSNELPWHYLPVWLAIQTPLPVLALLLAGLVAVLMRPRWRWSWPRDAGLLLVVGGLLAPLAIVLATRPVLYDAARHFQFLLPPLAVLTGLSIETLLVRLERRAPGRRALQTAAGAAALLLACAPVGELRRLHPYQYVYFNEIVGGLPGASGRFDLDYWGHSLREATLGLVAQRRQTDASAAPRRVFVCGPPVSATYYFPTSLQRVRSAREADFAIVLRRAFCNLPYRRLVPLLTVTREDVPLSYVYDFADRGRALPEIEDLR